MEQRIETFAGSYMQHPKRNDKGSAFDRAKAYSEQLSKDGWFIHQTISDRFYRYDDEPASVMVMVVYRRKG